MKRGERCVGTQKEQIRGSFGVKHTVCDVRIVFNVTLRHRHQHQHRHRHRHPLLLTRFFSVSRAKPINQPAAGVG